MYFEVILSQMEGVHTTYQRAGNFIQAAIMAVSDFIDNNCYTPTSGIFSVENLGTGNIEEIPLWEVYAIMALAGDE